MKRAMWIASALLTLGFSACDRSSSPAYTPGAPASPTASSADQEAGTTERTQTGGNSVGRGPDVEGGTEGRTGFESPGDDEQTGGWVQSATGARAEETVEGVQLVFTTDRDVDGLRSEVRERADELDERCTTMR